MKQLKPAQRKENVELRHLNSLRTQWFKARGLKFRSLSKVFQSMCLLVSFMGPWGLNALAPNESRLLC